MNLSPDEKLNLLKMEFPSLDLDSDEDIERYFELRRNGSHQDALRVYNSILRRKFPNETTRILLLRYYRANDPRYHILLGQHIRQMADNFAVRVQNALYTLTKDVEILNVSDAYAVIKTIEKIITMLAPERSAAPAAAEKFVAYADKIRYRQQLMRKTAELVRQYIAESLDSVESLRHSVEEQRKQAAAIAERAEIDARISAKEKAAAALHRKKTGRTETKKAPEPQKSIFDLSRISFAPADIARIEIPKSITRLEDRVLAYCLRYWPFSNDPAFERTIFLYSKKFGTKNFDIYNVIKIGRAQGRRDGDILTSVLGVLTTGYFYSVQGDRYLQIVWRRLHSGDTAAIDTSQIQNSKSENGTVAASPATAMTTTPPKGASAVPATAAANTKKQKTAYKVPSLPPRRRSTQAAAAVPVSATKNAGDSVSAKIKSAVHSAAPELRRNKQSMRPTKRSATNLQPTMLPTPIPPQPKKQKSTAISHSALLRPAKKTVPNTAAKVRFAEAEIAGTPDFTCSVADIIKQLSGKSYDVYKDVFFKTVRPFIRKELASCRVKQAHLFDTSQNKAEEIVYHFLTENYDNPFMNWQKSSQQSKVAMLGFHLETVHTIIRQWFLVTSK